MRAFFDLILGGNDTDQSVAHSYDLHEFDEVPLYRPGKLPDDFFAKVKFTIYPGKPSDFLHRWQIMSPAMLNVFERFAKHDIQVFEVPITDSEGRPVLTDFRLVHVTRELEGTIDLNSSITSEMTILGTKLLNIITPVLLGDRIPQNVHAYSPKERISTVFVSGEFASALTKAKLKGFELVQLRVI